MKHPRAFSRLAVCLFLAHVAAAQVTGTGTPNYIPLWTGSTALADSKIYQTGSNVGIGTTTPKWPLDVSGHINSGVGYLIGEKLILTTPGGSTHNNIALGLDALSSGPTGTSNTAVGNFALWKNTSGIDNAACGYQALENNTAGNYNTAVGDAALDLNGSGNYNTAVGDLALVDNAGSYNTAIGSESGGVAGSNNISIGSTAGENVRGSNNIEIANLGSSSDSGVIRIGTSGTQSRFFAAGIYGASSGNSDAIPVLVDSSGQLVTVSSSRRFKEDVQDMGDASSDLMRLRPVIFRYRKPLANGSQPIQYGLIAEEVAEVYPDLVAHSADGQIETVKYQLLDPMLLNEVQRQQAEIHELEERLDKMEAALAAVSGAPESR